MYTHWLQTILNTYVTVSLNVQISHAILKVSKPLLLFQLTFVQLILKNLNDIFYHWWLVVYVHILLSFVIDN